MWGIRLADSVHLHDMGFIPAHAGNTVPYGHVPGLCQVHPRSRGEYDGVITSIGLNLGSPPLTRGIRSMCKRTCRPPGFIPAHAGNTCPPVFLNLLISGSSPLTRGILLHAVEISRSCRFTPAHAGNTESVPAMFLQAQVHPRSRGEYFSVLVPVIRDIGSPPLTRGILRLN